MKLNREELTIGAVFGLSFCLKVGFWGLLIAPFTAFLWALGGAEGSSKAFRRVGCAVVPSVAVAIIRASWLPIVAVLPAFGVLCLGYGIPSIQPPDDGSAIGMAWFNATGGDEKLSHILTRVTIFILLAIAFIPVWIS